MWAWKKKKKPNPTNKKSTIWQVSPHQSHRTDEFTLRENCIWAQSQGSSTDFFEYDSQSFREYSPLICILPMKLWMKAQFFQNDWEKDYGTLWRQTFPWTPRAVCVFKSILWQYCSFASHCLVLFFLSRLALLVLYRCCGKSAAELKNT